MIGQLQDAGNTTTLAHYLELLSAAGMVTGISKFSIKRLQQRGSSPKLIVLNTTFISAQSRMTFEAARQDRDFWGRLVESAAGAHAINSAAGTNIEVFYWRERGKEVDFVLRNGKNVVVVEVTSSRHKDTIPGMAEFSKKFRPFRKLLIGGQGIQLEEWLATPVAHWFR